MTPKDIQSQRNIGGKIYKFGGAFWYKGGAERQAKGLRKDGMGRPFMTVRIIKLNSKNWRLPLPLGEIIPETRRIGMSRSDRLTNDIYVVYYKHYRDWE